MVLKKIIENYNNKHVSVAPSPLRNHNHLIHTQPRLKPHDTPVDGSGRPLDLPVQLQRLAQRVLRDVQWILYQIQLAFQRVLQNL